jgi:hypothetical protein
MRRAIFVIALLGAAAVAQEKSMTTFNFDADTPGQAPKGFQFGLTGKGKPGQWIVQAVNDAPSGKNVLVQGDVHLYRVVKGRRDRFAGWNGKVASGAWHELAVEMAGDHIQVFFDGKKVIDEHDGTFKKAGKFGVWTKADSIIQFDDLTAAAR